MHLAHLPEHAEHFAQDELLPGRLCVGGAGGVVEASEGGVIKLCVCIVAKRSHLSPPPQRAPPICRNTLLGPFSAHDGSHGLVMFPKRVDI